MFADAEPICHRWLDRLSQALKSSGLKIRLDGASIPCREVDCDGKPLLERYRKVEISLADLVGRMTRLAVTLLDRTGEIARVCEPGRRTGLDTSEEDIPRRDPRPVHRKDAGAEGRLHQTVQTCFDKASDTADATVHCGQFEDGHRTVMLPLLIETRDEPRIIDTVEMMRRCFRHRNGTCGINRATGVTRNMYRAEVVAKDAPTATFRAHILIGPHIALEPGNSACTKRRIDGLWHISRLRSALGLSDWSKRPDDPNILAATESGDSNTI